MVRWIRRKLAERIERKANEVDERYASIDTSDPLMADSLAAHWKRFASSLRALSADVRGAA